MKIAGIMQVKNYSDRCNAFWTLKNLTDIIIVLDNNSAQDFQYERSCDVYMAHRQYSIGGRWNCTSNQTLLFHQAWIHGCDWVMRLDDDMKIVNGWKSLDDLKLWLERASEGWDRLNLPLYDLWGDEKHIRVDGVWGNKVFPVFTRNPFLRQPIQFNPSPFHQADITTRAVPALTINRYDGSPFVIHSGCMTPERRLDRVKKWKHLDPEKKYQPLGYDYMTCEKGMTLKEI